ncbi:MAG: hypothetical protein JNM57_13395 [Cyclobacteriaceae bacterium]|nr:hypothetical protein [Cyclobacteriaceae bacterium]
MKEILLIIVIGHIGYGVHCQGSWDIGYIEVDSITARQIGESVKIDFKHFNAGSKRTSKWVRPYVTPQDTATISFNGTESQVIEKRKIYVDQGSFNEQYLEIVDQDKLLIKKIYDSKLVEVTSDSLKFLVTIDFYDKQSNGREGRNSSTMKMLWINRESLDGIMIKNQ